MTPAQAGAAARSVALAAAGDAGPLQVQGKFFFTGDQKFYMKAVSYGPFKTASHGTQFPDRDMVERDFALMTDLGANVIRTFTVPPRWLLDRAEAHDLRVMIGIPWAEHICFLDSPSVSEEIRETIRSAVRDSLGHPAVFAYIIGNEIPPDIVRWYGPERTQDFLHLLRDDIKALAPNALVSYANFPPTEYLDLEFLDFVCFNVYLHHEDDFRRYLGRLQNIAVDRPLVLTEHGIDSVRLGDDVQAETLAWQVRAAFESGLAGTCIFSWTDDWFTGGHQIEDWSFGLVTRDRQRKPSFHAVRAQYSAPLPPPLLQYPKVSVVICAYNAERTMDPCLASLERIRYPNYEVVIVNDGSRDATQAISERYVASNPRLFTLINQVNKGLSVARNVGMEASTGEIIAYTDSDCVVDPDWLTYLVYKFQAGFIAVGGPNFPPPEASAVAAYVAASPGGPTHVLLNDEIAEHIPGCNMAFRKQILGEIGGFQPIFTAAGDDVDLCWRLQNLGHAIGFSPSAMVWHFRRNTVRDYLNQQRGYGKAEALLYFKHPYRFNMLGQSRWLGRIYGDFTTSLFSRRPVIYSGTFGRGLFQTLYEPPSSLFAFLPFTLEWNVVAALLVIAAFAAGKYYMLASIPLAITFVSSAVSARYARIDPRYDHWRGRALVAMLIYLGPLLRSYERYRWRVKGLTDVERIRFAEMRQRPRIRWLRREFFLRYWSESSQEKEELLEGVIRFLLPRKYLIAHDMGWSDWDLEIHRGIAAKSQVRVAAENHGGTKRLLNVRCAIKTSRAAKLALWFAGGLVVAGAYLMVTDLLIVAVLLATLITGSIFYQAVRLARTMYQVIEIVAQQIGLEPMGVGRLTAAAPPVPGARSRRFPLIRTVAHYLKPHRAGFVFALFQVVLISTCELLKPWPMKLVVDNVLGGAPVAWAPAAGLTPHQLLAAICVGLVALYVVLAVLSTLNNATTIAIGQGMVNNFRLDLYQHLQRLSLKFHTSREVGDLLYRVTADAFAIQTLSMNGVFPIITSLVLFGGMVVVMGRMDWVLTIVALAVCPIIFFGISLLGHRINAIATEARQKESRLYSIAQRGIAAIRVIQAFTTEEEEARQFAASSTDSLRANLRMYMMQTFYSGAINVIIAVGTALVLWVGASKVLDGTLTIGQVLVFTTYLASLYAPINSISQTIGMIHGARAGAERALEILATAPDLPDGTRTLDVKTMRGEVTFEHVRFEYSSDRPVLQDVDLVAKAGQVVAIVGPTGVGKSTLVSLVGRFYDPVAGRVLLDGVDLREFQLRELRSRIAMVLQPALVFPTTLRENIAYGRPFATEQEIARAAHLAQLDGLLARMPQGLSTPVGEQGATLSDGERQRVTIARAIIRDAPLLILDEPTSALDAETEALIIAALQELMRGRTTFVIAHRLSTIRHADQIVVLRDGTVAERGTFDELVARGGAFTRLYEAQFGRTPGKAAG